ncbi:MAG TPA: OmpA family protein [Blastocatellia bacterium]|nr:OmpA family protein [Blastocatellia bacterium]
MKKRLIQFAALSVVVVIGSVGCATKKYVRNRVNERVTPLEQRTGELEETSRRNTQDIGRLGEDITEVRGRTERAQTQADAALGRADEANKRAGAAEQSVTDLRANLDKYALQNTATVHFKFDSYELTQEGKASLDQLAAQIRDRSNFILEVTGFADSVGSEAYNNQLTEKRADAVRRYLAEQHNIPLFRMHMLGFGELRAVADNHSSEGRAQNRRVEIRLLSRGLGTASTRSTTSTQR